ncbi:hypothetical protein LOTGIDRAFT_152669 [Lottia gigantea]|uniref:Uncharacterized protein n=1 Tax=Lottia gigantea TaxID=225164 RepID=V4ARV2_LOTGI|nr:hypothetical protein LOTGIDRAFT_152669 [Lottia gigantea]ESO97580.1 hypothetical protein LOTGIDRAFT_152669 [Lottia gigantea]
MCARMTIPHCTLRRPHSRFNFGLFPKRGCSGFPCMYTHLGAKAGRQELMRTLMSLIDDCAGDIACSPGSKVVSGVTFSPTRNLGFDISLSGKRKRRSLRNLQKRLQTTNLRDSKLAA